MYWQCVDRCTYTHRYDCRNIAKSQIDYNDWPHFVCVGHVLCKQCGFRDRPFLILNNSFSFSYRQQRIRMLCVWLCSWTIFLSLDMWYFIIEDFLNEKYCHQLEAHKIALNVDVGLDEEAEGERQMQWEAQSHFTTFHRGGSYYINSWVSCIAKLNSFQTGTNFVRYNSSQELGINRTEVKRFSYTFMHPAL